jgi:putative RecB family exonuclease
MSRKPVLSPTKIATYLECAMKYRYIYVDRIGRFYLRAHSYYSFGSTLHQVLQNFHEEGGVQSREQMVEQYEQKWISAGYETPEQEQEYRAAGAEIVQAYHAAATERAAQEVETLYVEKTISADLGPFLLSGRVDRIDRHADGTLEIVDYKSGRWETTPEEVAADLAMNIYQLIMRRLHPGTRVIATIYCLRSGSQASAEMSDAEAETFAADLLALGEEIIHRDYENVEPVPCPACPTCEFLPRCERFWREQARREM